MGKGPTKGQQGVYHLLLFTPRALLYSRNTKQKQHISLKLLLRMPLIFSFRNKN
jgi:hypothetical protein